MFDNSCEHTYRLLDGLHISYEKRHDSTNDGISGRKTCEALGCGPEAVYKTVMVLSDKKNHPYIAVLPANRKLDPAKFGQAAKTPCHKAGKNFIRENCSESEGLFGPFFPKNIRVLLDETAKCRETLVVNAGGAGNYIELAVSDLVSAVGACYGDLAGDESVELYGRNRALPIGAEVAGFSVAAVRAVTPLEIFYTAKESGTGKKVSVCEYFPRFHGYYAARDAEGVGVKWLQYTNDMEPRYSQDSCFEAKNRGKNAVLDAFGTTHRPDAIFTEQNGTFYTIFDPVPGKSVAEIAAGDGSADPEGLTRAVLSLADVIREKNKPVRCIRPDTVYWDEEREKACFLPFCAPTALFGQGGGMRFMYNANYDPFMVEDEMALYRVLCCGLLGKRWYSYRSKADTIEMLKALLPEETALRITRGAGWQ